MYLFFSVGNLGLEIVFLYYLIILKLNKILFRFVYGSLVLDIGSVRIVGRIQCFKSDMYNKHNMIHKIYSYCREQR